MRIILLIALSTILCLGVYSQNAPSVHVNSLGFKPQSIKIASVTGGGGEFTVVDAKSGEKVFTAKLVGPAKQNDVNQEVYKANFTEFKAVGTYYLQLADGTKSPEFKIGGKVYDDAYVASMRAFYLWRCGTAVEGEHNGDVFNQKACHLDDGHLDFTEFGEKHKDGTGGWHDAGDHGKYIVNGALALGQLFFGWQDFQNTLENKELNLPNHYDNIPEYLEELKWETDWFLKMQYPDGSGRVSHKLTRTHFSGFIMPEDDKEKRYYTPWSTSATAHFAAAMALAYRNFKPYDETYANKCLDAAKLSYKYMTEHPEYVKANLEGFHTGGYMPNETDGLIWAAAEMWEATGEEQYLKDFEERIQKVARLVDYSWDWGGVKNLGVYTYLLSERQGKSEVLFTKMKNELIAIADSISDHTQTDVYGRPSALYEWGCNGAIARLASNLYVASKLNNDKKYKEAAEQIVGHIFGRNYYGRSYVTGLGVNPPMKPHDRRSGADGIDNPWPGYIVGGGHTATDWVDEEASYSHNEVCINWQASLVYLMTWVVSE